MLPPLTLMADSLSSVVSFDKLNTLFDTEKQMALRHLTINEKRYEVYLANSLTFDLGLNRR